MPIAFVVTGIVLILTCFNVFNLKNKLTKREIMIFSLLIFLGYLIGNVEIDVYMFNSIHLICICAFLLISMFKYKKIFFNSIILSIIIATIYYICLFEFGLSISTKIAVYLLVIIQLCFNRSFKIGVVNFVLSYSLILLLNIRFEVLEYSFVSIDFNLCFIGLTMYFLLFVICKLFAYLILNKSIKFEVDYEKKNFYNSTTAFNY